jgi:large conductance mechanosensitive channel
LPAGNFITVALNFIIPAFIIFMMIKQMNRLRSLLARRTGAPTAEDIVRCCVKFATA